MNPADCQPKLQKKYQRETWQELLPQLLPGVEMFSQAHDFPLTSSHERDIATARRQFGAATLADGKRIAFYEIEVAPDIQLQSNRVGLRSLIVKCIDEVSAHAVLAFFVQPGKSFYRLTYAAKESRLGEDLKIKTEQTAPRRFTYILGEGESCRTAAERFGKLPSNTKIADLTEAFSVDKLNKEFFADFSKAFDVVVKDILARNKGWEQPDAERETQTLLNRLLFLYFIQRKGWLDRRRKYLITTFNQFHQNDPEGTSFNDQFLKPFFVKLSAEDAYFPNLDLGDLPFLNGGLFDDEIGSLTERGRMKVGNPAFRHVFDRLLEAYNFTVREDTPLDQEVAIDPEMIGKIFESLVLQLEQSDAGGKTSRHDTGSYYTPRPIVHYLCREGLRAWMEQFPPNKAKSSDWPARLEKLFALDASDGIDDDERVQLNGLLTPDEARTLLDRLDDFRACDPAVGSGAFLVGLLHELVNLRRLCESRSRGKDPAADIEWLYETKKRVIENVLYGVDIQQRAVEICKLRLWISLMVDYPLEVDPDNCALPDFRRALKKITPLPNLDFKIRRANSLIEQIRGHAIKFPQSATDSRDFALSLSKLATAKHRFYEARKKKDKRLAQLDALDATAELAQYEFSAAKLKFGLLPSDDDADGVAELARAEAEMGKLQMQIASARKKGERDKDDDIERLSRVFNDEAKPSFVWQLDFAEIFHRSSKTISSDSLLPTKTENSRCEQSKISGFDLVLGNPPYLGGRLWKEAGGRKYDYFINHFKVAEYQFDIYALFWELGIETLNESGVIGFITPNTWLNNKGSTKLREFMLERTKIISITDYSRIKVFSQAVVLPIITILKRAENPTGDVEIFLPDTGRVLLSHRTPQALWKDDENKIFNIALKEQDLAIRKQIERNSVALETLAEVKFGIKIYETGKGTPPQKATDAPEHVFEANTKINSHYRKYLEGKDVNRYSVNWKNRWLKYGPNLAAPRDPSLFEGKRLLVRRIVGECLISTFTEEDYVTSQLLQVVKPHDPNLAKYILGILNSTVLAYYFKKKYNRQDKTFPEIRIYELASLPIHVLDLSKSEDRAQHSIVVCFVEWLLWLHGQPSVLEGSGENSQGPVMVAYFEQLLNALVFELVFTEELHAAKKYFFKHLAEERLPALDEIKGDKLAKLRSIFERLFDKEHIIRKNCFFLDTLETVRIIEGKA